MSAPEHLSPSARDIWDEVMLDRPEIGPLLLRSALEAYCAQVGRMRDAQTRVDNEGLVVADEKGRPIPHPALEIERQAQIQARLWAEKLGLSVPAEVVVKRDAIDEIAERRAARRTPGSKTSGGFKHPS